MTTPMLVNLASLLDDAKLLNWSDSTVGLTAFGALIVMAQRLPVMGMMTRSAAVPLSSCSRPSRTPATACRTAFVTV